MTPGWLDLAMAEVFGTDAPACLVCRDDGFLLVEAVPGGDSAVVACPFHKRQAFTVVPWRVDQRRGVA